MSSLGIMRLLASARRSSLPTKTLREMRCKGLAFANVVHNGKQDPVAINFFSAFECTRLYAQRRCDVAKYRLARSQMLAVDVSSGGAVDFLFHAFGGVSATSSVASPVKR